MIHHFDVLVIGGGHAGIEAAYASAKMGSKTGLVTLSRNTIGLMPCNPAIGGIGKGHIVFEISALGGLMPQLCTKSYLQVRMLNTSKGPAVQGLRLQIDKVVYQKLSAEHLSNTKNLTIIEAHVTELLLKEKNTVIYGLRCQGGYEYHARQIVITTGTFLNGKMHIGTLNYPGGRRDEQAALALSQSIVQTGLTMGKLKTGTPPRILRESIDFSKLTPQIPDCPTYLFEFKQHHVLNSHTCYIAKTNTKTHDIF